MLGHVLVVDDEPHIRTLLRAYLEKEGYDVTEVGLAAAALTALGFDDSPGAERGQGAGVDLVLLDVGLPDGDGVEVLRQIRSRSELPVILVTARAEEVDTLVGLSVGADDYVTKPFSPREVVARVKTVLRRSQRMSSRAGVTGGATSGRSGRSGRSGSEAAPDADGVLRTAGFTLDPLRRELRLATGELVHLSALEFDIVRVLAGSPGRVFSRAQLLEQVWGYDFFGDERVVDVHIRHIRKVLGDDAEAPRMIGTVRGVGYKLLASEGPAVARAESVGDAP